MMRCKENIILADCEKEEVMTLATTLRYDSKTFSIKSHIANWKRTGKLSEFRRYVKYFLIGFIYFIKRKDYSVIIGWQQFYALIYCFFCELFHVRKLNIVVALNYTYKAKKGIMAKPYRWFMCKCLSTRYMDFIHVLSENYAEEIHKEFHFPRERIIVTPFGVNDQYAALSYLDTPVGYQKNGYALSIGRSNRDFDFLIRAWNDIDYPLVIISDTYKNKVKLSNVSLLSNVSGDESYPWIANCGLMVIPIDDERICSGDTVLLTAMSLACKIIVTKPSTLAEMYIEDGKNALLSRKEIPEFRNRINEILFSGKYDDLGEQARKCFLEEFTRKNMGEKLNKVLNS